MSYWKNGLCAMLAYGVTISAASAQLDEQQMRSIRNTAASICNSVEEARAAKGRTSNAQLQGDINAQLSGLLGKIGSSAKGSLTREEFEGLSQDAFATAMAGDRDCRERVFNRMFDRIVDKPPQPPGANVCHAGGRVCQTSLPKGSYCFCDPSGAEGPGLVGPE
jgi:hypothetical protein